MRFDELRGLEAERPDEDPVAGAVDVFAEHKVCNKQQNGADGDVEPQLHDALEVAHEPNKEAEKHNADAERGNLHFNGVEPLTAEEQDADAAEEQPTVSISKLTRFKMRREKKYSIQLAVNRITNGAAG
jgi:hypothetical protein